MPKIEDYALLGDLHTAALVSTAGSIDWLCLPRFDSPAAFAALLHNDEAGHWTLAPAAGTRCTSRRLRFDYGRVVPWVRHQGNRADIIAGPDRVRLMSAVPVQGHDWETRADLTVRKGDRVSFVMSWTPGHRTDMPYIDAEQALSATTEFWTDWSAQAAYQPGPYTQAVDRSIITLKAPTYEPDNGLWEVRGDRQRFTHSKIMAWVAADALCAAGRLKDATQLFERLLLLRNDVGLLSEEWDPAAQRQLGNTPQAFSHFALVVSALQLQMGRPARSDNPMRP